MRLLPDKEDFYSNKERTILAEVTHLKVDRTFGEKENNYVYVCQSKRERKKIA